MALSSGDMSRKATKPTQAVCSAVARMSVEKELLGSLAGPTMQVRGEQGGRSDPWSE